MPSAPPAASRDRRAPRRLLPLLLLVVLALAGCRVSVRVDAQVDAAGAGTVSVAVGLDDAAVARLGDVASAVRTDDLAAAGWTVTGPAKEADGLTWIRATKPVSSVDDLNRTLAEVAGPDGALRGFRIETIETDDATIHTLRGTVDLTKGIAAYSDADLAAQLDGDPFGGQLAKIEAEEGKPIADLVDVTVTARIGDGVARTVTPSLEDTKPVEIEATQSVAKPPGLAGIAVYAAIGIGLVLIVALMLVRVRRRFGSAAT